MHAPYQTHQLQRFQHGNDHHLDPTWSKPSKLPRFCSVGSRRISSVLDGRWQAFQTGVWTVGEPCFGVFRTFCLVIRLLCLHFPHISAQISSSQAGCYRCSLIFKSISLSPNRKADQFYSYFFESYRSEIKEKFDYERKSFWQPTINHVVERNT